MNAAVIFFSKAGETYVSGKIKKISIGNTEIVARKISRKLKIPAYRLQPLSLYPDSYKELKEIVKREKQQKTNVPYQKLSMDIATVDHLFLGYPNWFGEYPRIIGTFLQDYDFSKKIIYPFCTHEGNTFGESVRVLRDDCPGASVKKGLAIRGTRVLRADKAIEDWLIPYQIDYKNWRSR